MTEPRDDVALRAQELLADECMAPKGSYARLIRSGERSVKIDLDHALRAIARALSPVPEGVREALEDAALALPILLTMLKAAKLTEGVKVAEQMTERAQSLLAKLEQAGERVG